MDFLLEMPAGAQEADIAVEGLAFVKHSALRTAVILSLFVWRRPSEPSLEPLAARGGWWGDGIDEDGDEHGSRLYELADRPLDPERSAVEGEDLVREALAWMLEDGVAGEIDVDVQIVLPDRIELAIEIHEIQGETQRFAFVWDVIRGEVSDAA